MRIATLFRYMNTCRIYVQKPIAIIKVYAYALLRYINHINVPSYTNMRYYHFTNNFLDCICTEFISSNIIKQMIHLKQFHNPLFITIKCNFYRKKLHDLPLAATADHQRVSWWRHIDKYIEIIYLLITYRGGFSSDKYTFTL